MGYRMAPTEEAPPRTRRASAAGNDGPDALDEHDLAILSLLVADARISQRRMAREVGMSAPAVAERVSRMERGGVIRGYRADLNRSALGHDLVVYVGVVAVQGGDQPELVATLRSLSEVEDVHVVTGPKDLLVRLRVRDHAHLREVLFERLWSLPGVDRTETYISLAHMEPKDFDAELLEVMISERRQATSGETRQIKRR
jgi:Lrp/AsnC family transcriptional regulator, leucine-responsive regulatory protein